jgi:long-chain fatty acid transport protein
MLYELCDSTRFGLNYRSKIKVTPRGESIARNPSLPFLPLAVETRQRVRGTLTLPETALFSVYHDFCNQWAMMADVQWTHWQRFKRLTLQFQSLGPSLVGNTLTSEEHYKNTYRVALGVIRTFDECWKLRLGGAYDGSPTPNKFRTARIPDSNRAWLGIGAQYRLNSCMAIDAGYGHLFFKKARLDERAPLLSDGLPANAARLSGKYKTNVNLFGLQFTWDIA